jgi:hypothetical protein
VHILPSESNLEALRLPIVRKAANPSIVNGMVFHQKWLKDVLTVATTKCQQSAHQCDSGVQWSTSSGLASNWLVFTIKILMPRLDE